MSYTHLTLELRKKIEFLYQLGKSQAYMARRLGVSRSTLSRELRRNASGNSYNAHAAHNHAMKRKKRPQGILQENRPVGGGSVVRLRLKLSENLLKRKHKKNRFAPADTSIRMAHNKACYPFSGECLHRKSLTLQQKNKRRLYLKKRKRNHLLESQARGPRLWWAIIRSVVSKRNKKHALWYVKTDSSSKKISRTTSQKGFGKKSLFKIRLVAPAGRLRQAETALNPKEANYWGLSERDLFRAPP